MPLSRPGLSATGLLLLLVLLGWHVHARAKPEQKVNLADRALLAVTGPVQSRLADVARLIGGGADHYLYLVGVGRQNDELRDQLAVAQSELFELSELRSENQRLRQLNSLREWAPSQTVGASVIGHGTTSRFRTIRIDRGHRVGVEAGQPVVGIHGAVGRVLRASDHFADVLLLTDGLSAVGARLEQSRLRGVLLGGAGETLELGYVRRRDLGSIAPGERVVTSGEDQVFPEGVPLGRVLRAEMPETGLFLDLVVEPAVSVDRLEEVLVVLEPGEGPFSIDPAQWAPQPSSVTSANPPPGDTASVAEIDPVADPAEGRL
ncbi:MAG TPA: rod shape-determining protein MreC [Deltaproteobacteria bacterium]|nr:rod shape-determining protein MreC [Deltaproteobacteria bacterium]HCP46226.1 rod shape-determining protein MreC [Deltaproteobacteria bacterium]